MRKKEESKRAKRNKSAAERKKEEKRKLKEEMKRLRHLEKEKLEKQLEAFLKVSGASKKKVAEIRQSLADGEFDPKKYEVAMQTVFDEKYEGKADKHRPDWSDDEQGEEDLGIERGKMVLDDDAVLEAEDAADAAAPEEEEGGEEYETEMPKFDLQKYLDEHFPGSAVLTNRRGGGHSEREADPLQVPRGAPQQLRLHAHGDSLVRRDIFERTSGFTKASTVPDQVRASGT